MTIKKRVKRISITSLIVMLMMLTVGLNAEKCSAKPLKNVKVSVVSVGKKSIKFKIKNNRKNNVYFSVDFKLHKKKNGKWKRVKFKEDAKIPKTLLTVFPGKSKKYKYKWKDYFEENLKKGTYRITAFATKKTFKIK